MTTFQIDPELVQVDFYNNFSDYDSLEDIEEELGMGYEEWLAEKIPGYDTATSLRKVKEYFEMMKETETVPVYPEDCLELSDEDQDKLEKELVEKYFSEGYRNVVVLRDLLDHQENPCGWQLFLNK